MLLQMALFHHFLWLSNIPLSYIPVCMYTHTHTHTPPSSLSIYLLMDIECFHVLTFVHSAAMNIGVHVSFQIKFSLGMCPGVGLHDQMVTLFLAF